MNLVIRINLPIFVASLALLIHASGVKADVSNSADYSLEFASHGDSGIIVDAGAYSAVSQVKTRGIAVAKSDSALYSIMPAMAQSSPQTTVADWSLY